ncbi:MAG: hypothetical protein M1459_00195 [Patescibacteria group bacterium]|nr:hypothetical protein [Patescibacteria group bacterium]
MLSVFPTFLSYQQLSPFILRIVLGAVFLFWAYRQIRKHDKNKVKLIQGIVEGIAGILFIVGLFTQAVALVSAIYLIICIFERINRKAFLTDGVNYYLILLAISISLLVTGAGWWAFDLPL